MKEVLESKTSPILDKSIKAKVQLKYATWLDASAQSNTSAVIEEYQKAIKLNSQWEKGHYYLGRYYLKILDSQAALPNDRRSKSFRNGEYYPLISRNYLRALQYGVKYLYESLPKVMTLWLDFAEQNELQKDNSDPQIQSGRLHYLRILNIEIRKFYRRLPKYLFYTVFNQLLSRLCHPSKDVFNMLAEIITLVTCEYPRYVLWFLFAQSKSESTERCEKGKQVLRIALKSDCSKSISKDSGVSLFSFLGSAETLYDQLLRICTTPYRSKNSFGSLIRDFKFDHKAAPCGLVVPVRKTMSLTLPSEPAAIKNHHAFPISTRVTIDSFEDKVEILHSLQKPRKIVIRGSDGKRYNILCKPHDDLRKDARWMDFTTMIERLLNQNPETAKRKLVIMGYAVIPLNEHFGLIEWVKGTRAMRNLIQKGYNSRHININYTNLRQALGNPNMPLTTKLSNFNKLLDYFKPVLYTWFIEAFPDPNSWYSARNNFARATAVMSMVGYILGLGDRHGENILLSEKSGAVLHVDFDCLFEKGMELEVPERVPFRLTQNMVDACGINGIEGSFRKACEVTMSLLRANESTLMNILETFIHDPVIDWSSKRQKNNGGTTKGLPEASLLTIRQKIRGILDKDELPMSVEGQVEALILQATSAENLCQMYIGWMSFW